MINPLTVLCCVFFSHHSVILFPHHYFVLHEFIHLQFKTEKIKKIKNLQLHQDFFFFVSSMGSPCMAFDFDLEIGVAVQIDCITHTKKKSHCVAMPFCFRLDCHSRHRGMVNPELLMNFFFLLPLLSAFIKCIPMCYIKNHFSLSHT
jgi:hypothetical protein